jgi:hypothetical protein
MARNRDYSDFILFVKKNRNKDLSRTELLEKYKKEGGHIKRQKAFDLIREVLQIEKRENVRKTVKTITRIKRNNTYLDVGNKVEFWSKSKSSINDLYNKISDLYNTKADTFMSIRIRVEVDDYTSNNFFQIFIPYNRRAKQGSKTLGQKILSTLQTYYGNLAKMYSFKENTCQDIITTLHHVNKTLNKSKNLSFEDVKTIFLDYGLSVEDISLIGFTK